MTTVPFLTRSWFRLDPPLTQLNDPEILMRKAPEDSDIVRERLSVPRLSAAVYVDQHCSVRPAERERRGVLTPAHARRCESFRALIFSPYLSGNVLCLSVNDPGCTRARFLQ